MPFSHMIVEFDTAVQKESLTKQDVNTIINGLNLAYKVNVQELPGIVGLDIAYPSTLTPTEVEALHTALDSAFAMYVSEPIPDPLFLFDLKGIAAAGVTLVANQWISLQCFDAQGLNASGGGALESTGYSDAGNNTPGFPYATLQLGVEPGAAGTMTIPAGAITLTYDVSSKQLTNVAAIVMPVDSRKDFWIDHNGNLYVQAMYPNAGGNRTQFFTYGEAVAIGKV